MKKMSTRLFMDGKYQFVSQHGDERPAERKAEKLHKIGLSVRITSGFVEAGMGPFTHPALKWTVWSKEIPRGEIPKLRYDLYKRNEKKSVMERDLFAPMAKTVKRIVKKTTRKAKKR